MPAREINVDVLGASRSGRACGPNGGGGVARRAGGGSWGHATRRAAALVVEPGNAPCDARGYGCRCREGQDDTRPNRAQPDTLVDTTYSHGSHGHRSRQRPPTTVTQTQQRPRSQPSRCQLGAGHLVNARDGMAATADLAGHAQNPRSEKRRPHLAAVLTRVHPTTMIGHLGRSRWPRLANANGRGDAPPAGPRPSRGGGAATSCVALASATESRGQDVSERHRVVDHHLGAGAPRIRPPMSGRDAPRPAVCADPPADDSAGRSPDWPRRTTASRQPARSRPSGAPRMVPADLPRLKTEMAAIDAREEMLELLRSLHPRQRLSPNAGWARAAGHSPRAVICELR